MSSLDIKNWPGPHFQTPGRFNTTLLADLKLHATAVDDFIALKVLTSQILILVLMIFFLLSIPREFLADVF